MADQQQKQQHKQDKQKIDQQHLEEDDVGCVRDIELTDDHTLVSRSRRALGTFCAHITMSTTRWFKQPRDVAKHQTIQRSCAYAAHQQVHILVFLSARSCSSGCCLLLQHVAEQHALENDCGCVVWDAALVLVNYLVKQAEMGALNLKDKRVIELGAGTGAAEMLF
jgi:hypothetical protein